VLHLHCPLGLRDTNLSANVALSGGHTCEHSVITQATSQCEPTECIDLFLLDYIPVLFSENKYDDDK